MSKTFILAGNAPYTNKGCEAIIRGTVEIIRHHFDDPSFIVWSHFNTIEEFNEQKAKEYDSKIIHLTSIRRPMYPRFSFYWWQKQFLKLRKSDSEIFEYQLHQEIKPYIRQTNAVLSVGGDNYSLDYGVPDLFIMLDDYVMQADVPLMIWGASVGPFSKLPEYETFMSNHLKQIDTIFSRESVTTDYLQSIGISENVYDVADPAFLMKSKQPTQAIKIYDGAIGLNFSPLMAKFVTNGDMSKWEKLAGEIIDTVSEAFNTTIYLIPHVVHRPHNDDYDFMQRVISKHTAQRKNVILLGRDFSAEETKWIISRLRLFAGARTHATIAALSTKVPTLSFAYSIKALGLNKDIFGHLDYCLQPSDLSPQIVLSSIKKMLENESAIREELNQKIPIVQEKSLQSGAYLKELLK